MKKRDYSRVKAYVERQRAAALRAKGDSNLTAKVVYLHFATKELGLEPDVVTSCLDALAIEPRPLIGRRERSGFRQRGFSIWPMLGLPMYFPPLKPYGPPEPRKQRASWGSKKRVLNAIRKTKPWVIEQWWPEPTSRWHLYMEREDLVHRTTMSGIKTETISVPVAPEDQPRLDRPVIRKWHFNLDEAITTCAKLRRKYPTHTFRTRDTSVGDYVMAAIL